MTIGFPNSARRRLYFRDHVFNQYFSRPPEVMNVSILQSPTFFEISSASLLLTRKYAHFQNAILKTPGLWYLSEPFGTTALLQTFAPPAKKHSRANSVQYTRSLKSPSPFPELYFKSYNDPSFEFAYLRNHAVLKPCGLRRDCILTGCTHSLGQCADLRNFCKGCFRTVAAA